MKVIDELKLCFVNWSTKELLEIHHQRDELYPDSSVDGYYDHWDLIELLEDRLQEEM